MNEYAIGIDIGGTNSAYGIVDKQGNILAEGTVPTNVHEDVNLFLDDLYEDLNALIEKNGVKNQIKGIGVGAPNGNFFTGNIEFAPNLLWTGVIPIAELIKKRFNLPVVLTNDANAAAIGEMMYGAAKGMKHFIVITLGTGVGSGIVVNGDLVYGHDGFAGELGHTVVDPEGRLCGCGKQGCLETYSSATGIVRTVVEMLEDNQNESPLKKLGSQKITSKHIFEAATKGDIIALNAFEYTGKILGMKLADAIAFSSPQAIILFGGLSLAGKYIFEPTEKYMNYYSLPIFRNKVKLLVSELNDRNAAVLGASALAWKSI